MKGLSSYLLMALVVLALTLLELFCNSMGFETPLLDLFKERGPLLLDGADKCIVQ